MYPDQPAQPSTARGGPLQLTLGDALVGGGGLLIFLFSFAPFVAYDSAFVKRVGGGSSWWSAWARQTFMAPLTWWVIFAGALLVLLALSRQLWAPERERLGFRPSQLQVGLALFAFFVLVGYAFSAKTFAFGLTGLQEAVGTLGNINPGFSWGGVIMLFGSVVALIGSFLNHLGVGAVIYPRATAVAGPAPHDPHANWPGGESSPATQWPAGADADTPTVGGHEQWPGGTTAASPAYESPTVEPPSWAGPRSDQAPGEADPEDGSSAQR